MNFLRRILHYFRKVCYRVLGMRPMLETFMPFIDERLERMIDRICLLESQLNWRMHGLPSSFANVKLEQLGSLLGKEEIQDLLRKSQETQDATAQVQWFEKANFSENSIVAGSPILFAKQNEKILANMSKASLVCDPEDILSVLWFKDLPKTWRCVHTDILTFLLSLEDSSSDLIWLGDALTRLSPLKALLVLKHAYRVLKSNGKMSGLVHGQSITSQISYTFNWQSLRAIDIPETALSIENEIWSLLKFNELARMRV